MSNITKLFYVAWLMMPLLISLFCDNITGQIKLTMFVGYLAISIYTEKSNNFVSIVSFLTSAIWLLNYLLNK